jgi:adenylate cyclase
VSTITVAAERVVPGVPAHVWQFASDSDTINRVAGLPALRFEPFESPTSPARLIGYLPLLGKGLHFEEYPAVFVVGRYAEWRRVFPRGPVREVVIRAELEPAGGDRTTVRGVVQCEPRWPIPAGLLRWVLARAVRDLPAAIARMVEGARPASSPVRTAAFADAAERLRAHADAPCADAVLGYVRDADDVRVQRMRPYAIADQLGLPRRDLLSTCVAAAEVGLLDLAWVLVCPSCRNGTEVLPTLRAVNAPEGRCPACEVRFSLDMDSAVEVQFAPHTSIRRYETAVYCSGGPARTPHVVAQAVVAPGDDAALQAPAEPGHYRVAARGGYSQLLDVVTDGPVTAAFSTAVEEPEAVAVRVGGTVVARNAQESPTHVKIERLDGARDAATARDVSMIPAFRRRYATETLRPGLSLRVGRVALLFSDLADSTRLYGDIGDSLAFRVVQDHFEVLERAIVARGGIVVKTIGDAVMASFPDEDAAVGAGVDILAAFGPFRAGGEARARTDIKIGVYAGPCYVVTANGILDYFGQTVNTAARLQGVAASGELVVEARLAARARALGGSVGPAARVELKGVTERVDVARVRWPTTAGVPSLQA